MFGKKKKSSSQAPFTTPRDIFVFYLNTSRRTIESFQLGIPWSIIHLQNLYGSHSSNWLLSQLPMKVMTSLCFCWLNAITWLGHLGASQPHWVYETITPVEPPIVISAYRKEPLNHFSKVLTLLMYLLLKASVKTVSSETSWRAALRESHLFNPLHLFHP